MLKPGRNPIVSDSKERNLLPRPKCRVIHRGAGEPKMTVHCQIPRVDSKDIRTIVVDDSPAALRAMCSVVERQPNLKFVGAASNGTEALTLARVFQPDLVLLDLEMPIMNGIEATDCLRRDCPAARVVIVTVHNTQELQKLCFERGASGFVSKDALKDELPIVVSRLFGDGA